VISKADVAKYKNLKELAEACGKEFDMEPEVSAEFTFVFKETEDLVADITILNTKLEDKNMNLVFKNL